MLGAATWIIRQAEALAIAVLLVLAVSLSAAGSGTWSSAAVGSASEVVDFTSRVDGPAGGNWTLFDHRKVHVASDSVSDDSHADHDGLHGDHCGPQCNSAGNVDSVPDVPDRCGKGVVLPLCRMSDRDPAVEKSPPKSPFL